jgi:hypothetical protein
MLKKVASTVTIFAAIGMALVVGAFFLAGGPQHETAEAGRVVTTEQATASAGAKVLPSEPKLRVEPK